MRQALDQAGERFAGWFSSCLSSSCLALADDYHGDSGVGGCQQQQTAQENSNKGKLCLTQPALEPPMSLSPCDNNLNNNYNDDLGHTPIHSQPTQPRAMRRDSILSLPSRASSFRASMTLRRKSTVRISAPSDFRRVQSMCEPPKPKPDHFEPIELSIYEDPEKSLPRLPSFNDFGRDNDNNNNNKHNEVDVPIQRPERTFLFHPHHSASTASYSLPRKPVGSGASHRRPSPTATAEPCPHQRSAISATKASNKRDSTLIPLFAAMHHSAPVPACPGTRASNASVDLATTGGGPKVAAAALERIARPRTPAHSSTVSTPTVAENDSPSPPTSPSSSLARHSRSRTLSGSTLAPQPSVSYKQISSPSSPTSVETEKFITPATTTTTTTGLSGAWGKGVDVTSASILSKPVAAMDFSYPTIYEGEQMMVGGHQQGYGFF